MEESASMDIRPAGASTIYNDELVSEISGMLERTESRSSECCIYRVPHHLRKWNEEAYTPQVISIGPFHHKNARLKGMEELKERFCCCFLGRGQLKLEYLVPTIREMEGRIRGCYDETIDLSSDRFVKMILVDASFILELICSRNSFSRNSGNPSIEETRAVAVMLDLVLLENQLPFFVLEKLYNLAFPSHSGGHGLFNHCVGYFGLFNNHNIWPESIGKIEHFTDLLRICRIPPPEKQPKRGHHSSGPYTATDLHDAGVKFKVISSDSCFDIKFRNGVLEIPFLELSDEMEVVYRNIVALEQVRYIEEGYFVEYLTFMALLITTRKDVDLLCDKNILFNGLDNSYAAALMIKKLSKGICFIGRRHDYIVVCEELRSFYDRMSHRRWMALLKREYFSTPSQATSTIVSLGVITVLTLIQTVCSIMQVKGSS